MENQDIITDSHARSIIKGITWRITGTLDTMVMAFIVTGELTNAIKIGFTEVFTKIFLYYLHERVWNNVAYGRIAGAGPSHSRSLIKGITWRVIGTLDTILISYIITGHSLKAFKIGGLEVFSKIGLFYLHERLWSIIKWGRIRKPALAIPVPAGDLNDKKD
jgi:uncharacterized membrane protein